MRHRHRFAMTMALVIVVSGLAGVRGVSGRGDESAPAALELPEHPLQAGRAEVVLRLALPAGYEINRDAPSRLTVTSEGAAVSVDGTAARQVLAPKSRELRAPLTVAAAGAVGMLRIDAAIYYCREGKAALCHLATPAWSVPVRSSSAGPTTLTIDYRVTPPA